MPELQSTLKGTPPCSSHTNAVLKDTYIAGQEEGGCVSRKEACKSRSIIIHQKLNQS